MFKYIKGIIKNLFNSGVSILTIIDSTSVVSNKGHVWGFCIVNNSNVGDYSYVGRNTRLVHATIGKYCSIAGECAIGMGTHTLSYLSTSSIFTAKNNGTKIKWVDKNIVEEYKPVIIGNDVWIGSRVMIMGGVVIGDGAVIGAGAIVTKDVLPYAIVGGVPAKLIRYRFDENTIYKLLQSQWWHKNDSEIKKNISVFQSPLSKEILQTL